MGFVVAVLTAVTALVALAIGVFTPAHSGPYCRSDCVGYPCTGGAVGLSSEQAWPGARRALAGASGGSS